MLTIRKPYQPRAVGPISDSVIGHMLDFVPPITLRFYAL